MLLKSNNPRKAKHDKISWLAHFCAYVFIILNYHYYYYYYYYSFYIRKDFNFRVRLQEGGKGGGAIIICASDKSVLSSCLCLCCFRALGCCFETLNPSFSEKYIWLALSGLRILRRTTVRGGRGGVGGGGGHNEGSSSPSFSASFCQPLCLA